MNTLPDCTIEYRVATWMSENVQKHPVRLFGIVRCFLKEGEYTGFKPVQQLDEFLTTRIRSRIPVKIKQLETALEKPIIDLDNFPNLYFSSNWRPLSN